MDDSVRGHINAADTFPGHNEQNDLVHRVEAGPLPVFVNPLFMDFQLNHELTL